VTSREGEKNEKMWDCRTNLSVSNALANFVRNREGGGKRKAERGGKGEIIKERNMEKEEIEMQRNGGREREQRVRVKWREGGRVWGKECESVCGGRERRGKYDKGK